MMCSSKINLNGCVYTCHYYRHKVIMKMMDIFGSSSCLDKQYNLRFLSAVSKWHPKASLVIENGTMCLKNNSNKH